MADVFETKRLVLKRFSTADAQGFYELNADPEVIRYSGDVPFRSVFEAGEFIRQYDHYDKYGFGRWSVFYRETGQYLGFCGLNYSPRLDEVDIGFRILRKHWGKGYATEAARGSIAYGFQEYGLGRIVGRAVKENTASHRVLEKLDMRFEKQFEMDGVIWFQYEILRESLMR
jgi:RimJ/RimL family protein N-acetyltransferase